MNECPSSSNTNAGKVDFFQPSSRFACECLWLRSRKMSVEKKRSSSIWPYAHAPEVRVYDSTWFHSFPRLLMSLRIFLEKEISWKYFSIANQPRWSHKSWLDTSNFWNSNSIDPFPAHLMTGSVEWGIFSQRCQTFHSTAALSIADAYPSVTARIANDSKCNATRSEAHNTSDVEMTKINHDVIVTARSREQTNSLITWKREKNRTRRTATCSSS